MPLGRGFLHGGAHRTDVLVLAVVDAGVEAEFVTHVGAFLGSTGDADRAAARHLRELTHDRTHGAAGCRHQHRFAGLRLADLVQAVPGRDARHADGTEVGRERDVLGLDLVQAGAVRDAVLLPAEVADDRVTDSELRVLGGFDDAGRAADHRLAERLRRRVRLGVVHAAAHVRIERQEVIAHQDLAGADARDRNALETEIVRRDGATLRAAGKDDALVGLGHGGAPRAKGHLRMGRGGWCRGGRSPARIGHRCEIWYQFVRSPRDRCLLWQCGGDRLHILRRVSAQRNSSSPLDSCRVAYDEQDLRAQRLEDLESIVSSRRASRTLTRPDGFSAAQ